MPATYILPLYTSKDHCGKFIPTTLKIITNDSTLRKWARNFGYIICLRIENMKEKLKTCLSIKQIRRERITNLKSREKSNWEQRTQILGHFSLMPSGSSTRDGWEAEHTFQHFTGWENENWIFRAGFSGGKPVKTHRFGAEPPKAYP